MERWCGSGSGVADSLGEGARPGLRDVVQAGRDHEVAQLPPGDEMLHSVPVGAGALGDEPRDPREPLAERRLDRRDVRRRLRVHLEHQQ